MTIIEQIKAEIERRITDNTFGAKLELIDILAWLDTLESEKPMNQEGVEDEIERYLRVECSSDDEPSVSEIARHFYDLGCRRTAEKYDEIEYNRRRASGRVLLGFEDEPKGIPGKDFVPVDWVETLEMYGKWKIVKLEEDGSSEIPNDLLDAQVEIVEKLIGENNNDGANAAHPFACEYVVELLQKAVSTGAKWQYQKDRGKFAQIKAKTWSEGFDACKRQMMKEAVPFYEILKAVPSGPERENVRIIIVKED